MGSKKQLSLVDEVIPTAAEPHCHRNRLGVTYYLHRGSTKTGKARYFFAQTVGPGAIATIPDGYEVAETPNGVVSVRKRGRIPAEDAEVVRRFLVRTPALRHCLMEVKGDAIVVHEVSSGPRGIGNLPPAKIRYQPVLRFEPAVRPEYLAFRMSYLGAGGWKALSRGALAEVVARYAPHIGQDSFFKLL